MAVEWSGLKAKLNEVGTGGIVGMCVVAPNGERWSHNGDRQFGAASTVKIPLMVEIFRGIDRGERTLADPYVLRDEDRAAGSGVMLHMSAGDTLTLWDLLYLTISISDNTATNLLIRMAGMDAVNATMRELGMPNSVLAREMKGRPAIEGEGENWATANDYANVMLSILNGTAASADSCAKMLDLLSKQQNARRIARYLPESSDIRWGSKTGSVTGVTNDVGFVTSSAGTVVIAVFCENFPDQHVGEYVIGALARAAFVATGVVEPTYTS